MDDSGWNSESRQAIMGAQVRVEAGERVRRSSWGHGLEVGLTGSQEEVTHHLSVGPTSKVGLGRQQGSLLPFSEAQEPLTCKSPWPLLLQPPPF